MQLNTKVPVIQQLLEAVLLNAGSIESLSLYEGKLGLSLCLFESTQYLNEESAENTAFNLLQEVLALRQKGKSVKPVEIGFVLLYLIENKLLDADFEEIFGEDKERLLKSIPVIKPYSETHLVFIPFLSLLYKQKKEELVCQLIVEILNGAAISLEHQFNQMQAGRLMPNLQKWGNVFEYYLKISSLVNNYIIPSHILDHYLTLYKRGRIPNRFITGFYIKKLALKDEKLYSLGKMIQQSAVQNIYPNTLTLSQRIDFLYLLNEADEKHYETPIQLLEKDLFDWDNPQYEKKIIQSIPPKHLIAGYGAGIARLLLYWVYRENKRNGQDCSRFKYLF